MTATPTVTVSRAISFDARNRSFLIRTKRSVYAFRILPDGQVVHVSFGPLRAELLGELRAEHLDDYPDASYVWDEQTRAYEYPCFGNISYHEPAIKASFAELSAPVQSLEAPNLPVRDLRLRYVSHEFRDDVEPLGAPAHGQRTPISSPRSTLCLLLKDARREFFVTVYYRVTPEHDIIERWVEIENQTDAPVELERVDFGVLNLPCGRYEVTRAAGAWGREFAPVRQKLEQGLLLLDQRGLNTGHAANPFFLVSECGKATEESGTVYFGAIAWSGNWRLAFESIATSPCRVFAGYENSDFSLRLGPGEAHTTPAYVFGVSADGRGGASLRLHRFLKERVLPSEGHEALRPVLYNSWEATEFQMSLQNQLELARLAASIGVELFVVDDGWFGARRSVHAGLGDWVVSEEVFPCGLECLSSEVRRLGMKFGLWVEPEMVNPDSDLYRAHPEWVLHFPGCPRTESRCQLVLDLGRPEVVRYILDALDKLVREHQVDFFKWDMNRYASEPGSVVGKAIWRRHVQALYHIMDELRRRHPRLDIQSCSGGGGRIDSGILARTEQAWTSDNTDPHDRVLIQEGFSLAYPPRAMECWVTDEKNPQTGRVNSLDFRFDVAMRGALGIGSPLNRLSPDELDAYRRKIEFYKKIRPVVQTGDLYRLEAADRSEYSIWLSVLPDASRAVYSFIVRGQVQAVHHAPPLLRGLAPEERYIVTDENGKELGRYPGWQLMTLGLPGDYCLGGLGCATRSRTLALERIS